MEKTELLKQSSDTVFMEDQQQQHIPTYCIFFFKSTIYYMGLSGCEFFFFYINSLHGARWQTMVATL